MKRVMIGIAVLGMCLVLSACSFLKKPKTEISFSIPNKQTFTILDEVHNYRFVHDATVERDDGFFEVFITRIDKDTGERQKIRYIYTADGILIGERDSGGDSQQDTILLLDLSFKGYTTDLEDSIDRIEDNRIYLKDGGYQDLELDGDRVLRVEGFSEDGTPIVDMQFNEWGQTESLTIFDEQGEESMKIRTTYETIGLDE